MATAPGTLILLGGEDLGDPELGRYLLAASVGPRVAVIPMASAFERPEQVVFEAAEWLRPLGGQVEGLMASSRADAGLTELAQRLDDADLAYVTDGTALHLRTTLKATLLFERLMAMLERGAVVAASGAAATVLCDPMIDPRGGAPTVGLGPVRAFTVVPHVGHDEDDPRQEKLHRTVMLAPASLPVVALPVGTALVCLPDGRYEVIGRGTVSVYRARELVAEGVESLGPWR